MASRNSSPTAAERMAARKTCPVTLEQFKAGAKDLPVTIGGQLMAAKVKAPFSTGSFGWNATGKVTLQIDGVPVEVQVGLNMIVVHSKPE